ncbi:MAG: hypothetical protein AAGF50_02210 [Pseudomonadota bacterium]
MDHPIRGAAPVGKLNEFPKWEAELVQNLRLWMDGNEGRSEVWNTYASALGKTSATASLNAFERLLLMIDTNMLRPMVRHSVGCRCLGSDEAVFLHLVRTASAGDLHEATMIATLIVRSANAEPLALLAASVGETLRLLHGNGHHPAPRKPKAQLLH